MPRQAAWLVHSIVVFALLTSIATWVVAVERDPIGAALAWFALAIAIGYAILATGAVAAWASRIRHVLAIHAVALALAVALAIALLR